MDLVTKKEASVLSGICTKTINNWLTSGKLTPYIIWKNKRKGVYLKKIPMISLQEIITVKQIKNL